MSATEVVDPAVLHQHLAGQPNEKIAELVWVAVSHAHDLTDEDDVALNNTITLKTALVEAAMRGVSQKQWIEGCKASGVMTSREAVAS